MSSAGLVIGEDLGAVISRTKSGIEDSVYFAAQVLWRYRFLDAPFHVSLGAFMDLTYPRLGILAPRGGGKSLLARAKVARDFLVSVDHGRVPHKLLASYNSMTAKKNLKEIHDMIAGAKSGGGVKELYHGVWSKIRNLPVSIASNGIVDWNKALRSDHPDPVFLAAGIDSGITSSHFDDALIDDLVDEVAARSPTEIRRSLEWVPTLYSCLDHQVESPVLLLGTNYGPDDVYSLMQDPREQIGSDFKWFIHAGLLEGENGKLYSYWPSKFTVEHLLKMRKEMGEYFFNALIQQSPSRHGDMFFKESEIKEWEWHPTRSQTLVLDSGEEIFLEDLHIFLVFDPALGKKYSSSDSSILVVGVDWKERWFVLDTWAERKPLAVAVKMVVSKIEQWEPLVSAVEAVLFQELLLPALKGMYPKLGYGALQLDPITPEGRNKVARIMALQPFFSRESVFLPRNGALKLRRQILDFRPDIDNKRAQVDLLDCLAYVPSVAFAPSTPRRAFDASLVNGRKASKKDRNPVTGY